MRHVDTNTEKGGEVLPGLRPVGNEAFSQFDIHLTLALRGERFVRRGGDHEET